MNARFCKGRIGRRPRWKRKYRTRDIWETEGLQDSQIPEHRMLSVAHRRDVVVKPPCALARVS